MAARTVARLTPWWAMRSRSDGIIAPGESSSSIAVSSAWRSCTCFGTGPSTSIVILSTRRLERWYAPVRTSEDAPPFQPCQPSDARRSIAA